MSNVLSSINRFSVLVAFLAYFMLGALWYMRLFPQLYKVSLGKADQTLDIKAPSTLSVQVYAYWPRSWLVPFYFTP